jgi:ParB family chromosome partitioning protein
MSTITKNPPAKSKSQSRGLGKGLSALMSDAYSPGAEAEAKRGPEIHTRDGAALTLLLEDIHPGKFQPRDHFDQRALLELAESIRKNGVVQPILVRRAQGGKYEIIAGERRWRAASMAGHRNIPAILRNFDDKKVLEIALVENVQREDLNPLEEAAGYQRLLFEFSYTQEDLAQAVHKSRSHIANLMRLLELPEEIRQLLQEDKITMGHARALAGVPNAIVLAHEVVEKGLSVRQTEKLARFSKSGAVNPRAIRQKIIEKSQAGTTQPPTETHQTTAYVGQSGSGQRDPDILALEETLSENLGLKVSINDRGQSGEIMIAYATLEQLDDILRRLGGSI